MKIKFILATVIILSAAICAAAQNNMKSDSKMTKSAALEQTLINNEKMAWKNLVDKKYDEFARVFADDYQGVYSEVVTTKATELAGVRQMTFKSADVTDSKVTFPTKDTAIVTSMVNVNAVRADGSEMSGNMRTTTVLAKRGKDWVVVYHSNVPVKM